MRTIPTLFGNLAALWAAVAVGGCSALDGFLGSPAQTGPAPDARMLEASVTIPVGTGPHGMTFAGGLVVDDNPGSGDISFIDPVTDKEVARVVMPEGNHGKAAPSYTKATHDGKLAVHLDGGAHGSPESNTLMRVVDADTHTLTQTVDLGAMPGSKFVWAGDALAYVPIGSATDSNVVAVDFSAGFDKPPALRKLTVTRPEAKAFTAGLLAAGGGYLAVANGPDNAVSFLQVDGAAQAAGPATSLTHGNNPGPIDISTYGGKATLVYGNRNSNTAVIYDLAARALVSILDVGSAPTDVALRADGRFAYMTCKGSGEVAVIDLADGKLVSLLKVGRGLAGVTPNPVHIHEAPVPEPAGMYRIQHEDSDLPARDQIWVGGDGDDSATVIDAQANKVVAVVKVGRGHHKMAFSADGKKAFVSNGTDNTVSVIDRTATW